MTKKQYENYRKSFGWWFKSKLKRFMSGGKCQICKMKSRGDIHHLTYKNLANEHFNELVHLCSDCHLALHLGDDYKIKNKPEYWGYLIIDYFKDGWDIEKEQICKFIIRRVVAHLIHTGKLKKLDIENTEKLVIKVIYNLVKGVRGNELGIRLERLTLDIIEYLRY